MNYWICVTNDHNWKVISTRNIWGVADHYKSSIGKVAIGDRLIFYVTGGLLVGIFEAASQVYEDDNTIFEANKSWKKGETYPHRIQIRPLTIPETPVRIHGFLDKLGFVKNRKMWMGYFYRAMLQISKDDYDILHDALVKERTFLSF